MNLTLFDDNLKPSSAALPPLPAAPLERIYATENEWEDGYYGTGGNYTFCADEPITIPAPSNGTTTSAESAQLVTSTGDSATKRAQVLAIIQSAGERGVTRSDIAAQMDYRPNLVAARVYELMGRAKDSTGTYPAPVVEELEETRIPDCGGRCRQGVVRAL